MKLEVGMYVRTLKGIVKIDEIKDGVMKDTKGCLHYGDFIKASHNIIDLIEVGDYVNGQRVDNIQNGQLLSTNSHDFCLENIVSYNEDIKSIVTKEQFESMKYSLEG